MRFFSQMRIFLLTFFFCALNSCFLAIDARYLVYPDTKIALERLYGPRFNFSFELYPLPTKNKGKSPCAWASVLWALTNNLNQFNESIDLGMIKELLEESRDPQNLPIVNLVVPNVTQSENPRIMCLDQETMAKVSFLLGQQLKNDRPISTECFSLYLFGLAEDVPLKEAIARNKRLAVLSEALNQMEQVKLFCQTLPKNSSPEPLKREKHPIIFHTHATAKYFNFKNRLDERSAGQYSLEHSSFFVKDLNALFCIEELADPIKMTIIFTTPFRDYGGTSAHAIVAQVESIGAGRPKQSSTIGQRRGLPAQPKPSLKIKIYDVAIEEKSHILPMASRISAQEFVRNLMELLYKITEFKADARTEADQELSPETIRNTIIEQANAILHE